MKTMRRRRSKLISMIVALLLGCVTGLDAQEREVLDDRRVEGLAEVKDVILLRFQGLDVAPDLQARAFRLPGGGWGVTSRAFSGEIQLFDSAGRPGTVLGRQGEGPGEFGGPVFGIATSEKLRVVDPTNQRLSSYSNDLVLLSDRPVPGRIVWAAGASDGAVLLSGFLSGSGGQAASVARIWPSGSGDQFWSDPASDWAESPDPLGFVVQSASGEVWVLSRSGGSVNILSEDFFLKERRRIPFDELQQEVPLRLDVTQERPVPQLAGVIADRNGMAWIVYHSPDINWRPGLDRSSGVEAFFDTRILAVDTASRAIVGETRLDSICLPVEEVWLSCVDELGQAVAIVELNVRKPFD